MKATWIIKQENAYIYFLKFIYLEEIRKHCLGVCSVVVESGLKLKIELFCEENPAAQWDATLKTSLTLPYWVLDGRPHIATMEASARWAVLFWGFLTSVKLRCHWKCQSMSRQQSGRRLTKFHFGENYLFYVRQGLARCVVSVSKSGRCLFLCLNIEKRSDRGCGWVSESPSFLSLCLSVSVKGCPPGSAHFLFSFFLPH